MPVSVPLALPSQKSFSTQLFTWCQASKLRSMRVPEACFLLSDLYSPSSLLMVKRLRHGAYYIFTAN